MAHSGWPASCPVTYRYKSLLPCQSHSCSFRRQRLFGTSNSVSHAHMIAALCPEDGSACEICPCRRLVYHSHAVLWPEQWHVALQVATDASCLLTLDLNTMTKAEAAFKVRLPSRHLYLKERAAWTQQPLAGSLPASCRQAALPHSPSLTSFAEARLSSS